MKKEEENYIHQVNIKSYLRFEKMKQIEEQINKQKTKFERLKEGQSVSETDSNISFENDKEASIKSAIIALNKFILRCYIPEIKKLLNRMRRSQKKRKTTKKFDPQYIKNNLKLNQNATDDKTSKKNVRDITKHPTMKRPKFKESEKTKSKAIEEKEGEEGESFTKNNFLKMKSLDMILIIFKIKKFKKLIMK